jgi:hypothetical protein
MPQPYPPVHPSDSTLYRLQVITLAAAVAKPAQVDTSNNGTEKCDWCCDNSHVDWGGNVMTHNACNNTGHMSGCQYRKKHLRR